MGSTVLPLLFYSLAAGCLVLFLILDATRYFLLRVSPVRLRRWTGVERQDGGASKWFQFNPNDGGLITGVLLQISLTFGMAFTATALYHRGALFAALTSAVVWSLIVTLWKVMLVLLPESAAAVMFRFIVPVTALLYYIFYPVVFPLRRLIETVEIRREDLPEDESNREEEVQAYIDVGEEEGILEEGEGKLLQSIVDFGDRVARELMTPRIDMLAFDVENSMEELARLFNESKYSRIPIYEKNVDKIIGIVHVKDVFDVYLKDGTMTVRELARPAYFIQETKKVAELLREFQIEHQQIAIVLDEYGGTAGIVSIEDVIEEIVGEISDEHEDEEQTLVQIDDANYLVNGMVKVEELEDLFGVELSGENYETVAGLIFTESGRVPKTGDVIRKGGLLFGVERADRKRIYRVRVSRDPEWVAPERNGRMRQERNHD
ncbi:MAG: hemolysin family protein [Acidobacteriota bacterium]